MTEQSLLQQAVKLPPDERAAFLDHACPDPQLRARLEALLAAAAAAEPAFESKPTKPYVSVDSPGTGGGEPSPADVSVDSPDVGVYQSLPERATPIAAVTPTPEPRTNVLQHQPGSAPILPPPPQDAPTIPGYAITRLVAKGGMGRVFAGHDLSLDREVAIKTLLPGADAGRFVVEAKITAWLPHPNIPPVHALGTLGDGTPWLAMKLVRGRTLADLLKERVSPQAELPRFVQIFESIAQAVGFAHSRGIIHRDLKPLNVMVGEFGEVQVMDWGLAKDTRDFPSRDGQGAVPDAASWPARLSDVQHTAAGAIMGTPGYMAPEQARGEVVDARADVFALGATLAAILTGQPAVVGMSQLDTIQKTANAELADVLGRLAACSADGELLDIARRCLSALPSDRFEDALGVAAAVAAYRAGVETRLQQARADEAASKAREAEAVKRRRVVLVAASGIAAVLLVGVVGTSIFALREQAAAARAEANAAAAVTQQGIAEANAEEARREADRANKEREMARRAIDKLTDAVVQERLATAEKLTEKDKAYLREVLGFYEQFARQGGNTPAARAEQAGGYFKVASIQAKLGESKDAIENYQAALTIQAALAQDFPSVPAYRQELARSHNNLGALLSEGGDAAGAQRNYQAALTIQAALAHDFPSVPQYRQDLAGSHNNLGALLSAGGDAAGAQRNYQAALTIQAALAQDFPSVPQYRQDLALSHNNLGALLRAGGDAAGAQRNIEAALTIRTALAHDFPSVPQYRQELARSHNNLGNLLSAGGDAAGAQRNIEAALTIRTALAHDFPSVPQYRQDLALSHHNLGLLLSAGGDAAGAQRNYQAALKIQAALAHDFPSVPQYRQDLALSHNNLGALLRAGGDAAGAQRNYQAALTIQAALAHDFPSVPEYRQDLALSHNNLGALLRAGGDAAGAQRNYQAALKIQAALAHDFPTIIDYAIDLGGTHVNLGNLVRDSGKAAEALDHYAQAIGVLAGVLKRQANHTTARLFLRNAHVGRAMALGGLKRHAEAAADWARAAELDNGQARASLRRREADAWARAGQADKALPLAETALQGKLTANDRYDLACILALCASAKKDEALAGRAVAELKKAWAAGYRHLPHLEANSDLDGLRGRDDFRAWLAAAKATWREPLKVKPRVLVE